MNWRGSWPSVFSEAIIIMVAVVVLATVTMPVVSSAALLSWIAGLGLIRLAKIQSIKSVTASMHCNLLAVGSLIACGHEWTIALALQLVAAALATVLLTAFFARLFYHYWVPLLLWPSLAVAWCLYPTAAAATPMTSSLAPWTVIYNVVLVVGASIVTSPIFALMVTVGAATGWVLQTLCVALQLSPVNPSILTTALQALGFAFCSCLLLMPSKRSLAWSLGGLLLLNLLFLSRSTQGNVAPELLILLTQSVFSFTLVIYGARIFSPLGAFWSWRFRPEQKLDDAVTQWGRFRVGEARCGLPFAGSWTVSQSFDGQWTHRGIWRHGLDFVVASSDGKTFVNKGFEVGDYYAFGKDVLAPTSGYVVAMAAQFPDNPIGSVNTLHKFGNYVIIRDAFGAHVLLAHFRKDSLTCKLYQYVEAGQIIGQCGNSGYSPEPHIHLHVQADAVVGSPTIPFHLTNYLAGERFWFHGVPLIGDTLTQPRVDANLTRQLSFEVDEVFAICRCDDSSLPATTITSRLDAASGSMYFTDGESKLYHYKDAYTFYFYWYEGRQEGPLFDLMTALPRVPLIYGSSCHYRDLLPVVQWRSHKQKWLTRLRQMFAANFRADSASFTMKSGTLEVLGAMQAGGHHVDTSCLLDPLDGFAEFAVGGRRYEVKSRRDRVGIGCVDSGFDSDGEVRKQSV